MTTLVATQQALELVSMSTQQERRKSKRRLAAATDFERDDDFQFVRKSKLPRTKEPEPEPEPKAAGEDSRTRRRETAATKPNSPSRRAASPENNETETSLVTDAPVGPSISPSRTGQRKSTRLKGSDAIPNKEEAAPQTRRRSTRNSTRIMSLEEEGDSEASKTNGASGVGAEDGKIKASKPVKRWEPSPTPQRRTGSSKIALPMNDTPVINRNKEMRKKGGKSNRRSSLGSRGRRASSLIDNGQTAIPHRDVDPKEFYKHIAGDLPEPRRMKQLLMWCGERALPKKPPHGTTNSEALLGARAIQNQILQEFATRSDFSNWFNRDSDSPSSTAILQPNPRNIELDEKLASLEAKIQRLQQEKQAWQAIRNPQPEISPIYDSSQQIIELPDLSLLEPEEVKIKTYLDDELIPFETIRSRTQERVKAIQSGLEFQIDQLADNVHKLEQRVLVAGTQADTVLALAAQRLKERERREREGVGTRDLPVMEVLRALRGILPGGVSEE